MNWTDEEISKAIKAGDNSREKAIEHIFYKLDWRGIAIAFVVKHGGNEFDGDEVAQLAMIGIDKNIRQGKYEGKSSLKTYFLSIVKFQWYKLLRGRKPLDEFNPEQHDLTENSVEDSYISQEKKTYLAKALGNIGDRCKKILLLRQLEYSLEEIAQQSGLSSAAMAKKEIYRCRMRFRDFLNQHPEWKDLID